MCVFGDAVKLDFSSSNSSTVVFADFCQASEELFYIFTVLFCSYYLLLTPLYVIVLHVAYQGWWKQCSVVRSQMWSHAEVITLNMVSLELIGVSGAFSYVLSLYVKQMSLMTLGRCIFMGVPVGQAMFHVLTCVERYLAVVHPITYQDLKNERGFMLRNIIIAFVWLTSFGFMAATCFCFIKMIFQVLLFLISTTVVCFCSLSVLCALIRAGPKKLRGKSVDQTKQRAFNTITAIMGALMLRFATDVAYIALNTSSAPGYRSKCLIMGILVWLCLPSSLILPLLFLHRRGKLPCCKQNSEHG